MFAAVIGSVAAAIIADRFGKLRPVCIGAVVYVVGILLLHVFHTRGIFALGAFLFYLPSNFLLAYSLGLTAEVDTGGRLIGVSTASMLGAPLIGPPIAGRLYEAYGFASNLMMGLVSVLLGAVFYAILLQIGRRTAVRGPANAEGVDAAPGETSALTVISMASRFSFGGSRRRMLRESTSAARRHVKAIAVKVQGVEVIAAHPMQEDARRVRLLGKALDRPRVLLLGGG